MAEDQELETLARAIIDANLYMTLATADESGRPWASPVYFAVDDYREFIWVSRPESTPPGTLMSGPSSASRSSTRACRSTPAKASTSPLSRVS